MSRLMPNGQVRRKIHLAEQPPNNCDCLGTPKIHTIECVANPEQPNNRDGIKLERLNIEKGPNGKGGYKLHAPITEQPNTNLVIIKTIQGLMTCVNDNLFKLQEINQLLVHKQRTLVLKALEEIDLFEKTTLFELQRCFE